MDAVDGRMSIGFWLLDRDLVLVKQSAADVQGQGWLSSIHGRHGITYCIDVPA